MRLNFRIAAELFPAPALSGARLDQGAEHALELYITNLDRLTRRYSRPDTRLATAQTEDSRPIHAGSWAAVPGASAQDMLAPLQDYDCLASRFSPSADVWQIEPPGSAEEHRRSAGDDDGFHGRLNPDWSLEGRTERTDERMRSAFAHRDYKRAGKERRREEMP